MLADAGFVDRDAVGGGGGAQEWAIAHNGTDATGSNQYDLIKINDWVGNPLADTSPWSMEAWFRMHAPPDNNSTLMKAGSNVAARTMPAVAGDNATRVLVNMLTENEYVTVWEVAGDTDGTTWIHFAFTWDPTVGTYGTYYFYKNGVEYEAHTITGTMDVTPDQPIWFIGNFEHPQRSQMDVFDIRIWDKFRSAADVLADYRTILNGDESGLVAWLRCNDGSGLSLIDETGNVTAAIENTNANITWVAITDPR
jgi:hypothetical protein